MTSYSFFRMIDLAIISHSRSERRNCQNTEAIEQFMSRSRGQGVCGALLLELDPSHEAAASAPQQPGAGEELLDRMKDADQPGRRGAPLGAPRRSTRAFDARQDGTRLAIGRFPSRELRLRGCATRAPTPSTFGGNPTRARCSRRSNLAGSARGASAIPSIASRARTNASIR